MPDCCNVVLHEEGRFSLRKCSNEPHLFTIFSDGVALDAWWHMPAYAFFSQAVHGAQHGKRVGWPENSFFQAVCEKLKLLGM